MATVNRQTAFRGFGDSVLIPNLRRPLSQLALADDRAHCRDVIRTLAPPAPGVYGWVDGNQQLLYVGKSKSLRHRLLSYFDKNPNEAKIERLRQQSTRIVWEPIAHDLLALIREQELIFRWRPTFNRQGQPERRRPGFLCVGGGIAPRVFLATEAAPKAELCIGPVVGLGELRVAIESLNYVLGLRDCSDRTRMNLTNQLTLFTETQNALCIRHELGSCMGPCASGCSAKGYRAAVQRAIAFLSGDDDSILAELQAEFDQALEKLAFERAAVLHQRLSSLSWLARRLNLRRRQRVELSGKFPIEAFDGTTVHMILDEGYLAGFASGVAERTQAAPHQGAEPTGGGLAVEWMLIIAGWFRKNQALKQTIQRPAMARSTKRASA